MLGEPSDERDASRAFPTRRESDEISPDSDPALPNISFPCPAVPTHQSRPLPPRRRRRQSRRCRALVWYIIGDHR